MGYSPFRGEPGYEDPLSAEMRSLVETDLATIAKYGFNAIRTWNVPPDWVLQLAADNNLFVLAGLGASAKGDFRNPNLIKAAEHSVYAEVLRASKFDNILGYLLLNEPDPESVVAAGPAAFAEYVTRLAGAAREADAKRPVSYAGWIHGDWPAPGAHLDFLAHNVYGYDLRLSRANIGYRGYLDWLHGRRNTPLVVTEFGYSVSPEGAGGLGYGGNTLIEQASGILQEWEVIASSSSGGFCFEFVDESWKGGDPSKKDRHAEEWFGLMAASPPAPAGVPRPAIKALSEAFGLSVMSPSDMARLPAGKLPLVVNSWPRDTQVEYRLNFGPWTPLRRVSDTCCAADVDTSEMEDQEFLVEFQSVTPAGCRQFRQRHVWMYKDAVPPEPLSVQLVMQGRIEEGEFKVRLQATLRDDRARPVSDHPVDVAVESLTRRRTYTGHGLTDSNGVFQADFAVDEPDDAWFRAFGSARYTRGNFHKTYWSVVPFTTVNARDVSSN